MSFSEHWHFIVQRSQDACMPVVQDREELEHVYNLLTNCKSYLEVGTAEGNSLYILAQALPKGSEITYIDWAEPHTEKNRNFVLERLKDYKITQVHENSNNLLTRELVNQSFDAVLIDAGHESWNVAIDAMLYGPLALKYVIFHDIQLPEVEKAYNWYCRQRPECRSYRVINSETFGFGILECTQ